MRNSMRCTTTTAEEIADRYEDLIDNLIKAIDNDLPKELVMCVVRYFESMDNPVQGEVMQCAEAICERTGLPRVKMYDVKDKIVRLIIQYHFSKS